MREQTTQIENERSQAKASLDSKPAQAADHQGPRNPASFLLGLQRTRGNRFVQRFLRSGLIQPRLEISEPGDLYEREADHIAERVMSMPASHPTDEYSRSAQGHEPYLQRACAECEEEMQRQPIEEEDQEQVRRQLIKEEEEEAIQPKLKVGPAGDAYEKEADRVAESVMHHHAIYQQPPQTVSRRTNPIQRQSLDEEDETESVMLAAQRKVKSDGILHRASPAENISESLLTAGGDRLPPFVQTFYEDRFGRDFSNVRVHTGAESASLNKSIHAHAFTYGDHVWLGQSQRVEPSMILAHELTHVVQQKQPPLLQPKSQKRRPDSGDE